VLVLCAVRYFYIHRKAHLDIQWALEHVPWHYDHHTGKDQDMNWGVTTDFWDIVFKTRKRVG
jgi:sterol desaturase/sphingolipid hydroxylase (fatty acid hydroxylase superfamily)